MSQTWDDDCAPEGFYKTADDETDDTLVMLGSAMLTAAFVFGLAVGFVLGRL